MGGSLGNICETRFKIKGKSRSEALREYAGEELAKMVCPGNMIVIERKQSEDNEELIERHPEEMTSILSHWIQSIYLIVRADKDPHGGVLAVNLTRRIAQPENRVIVEGLGRRRSPKRPLDIWKHDFLPLVNRLSSAISNVRKLIS